MDKVLGECVNQYLFQRLAQEVRERSERVNKEIGLWATPATWQQKYPKVDLDFIRGEAMGQLFGRGWAHLSGFGGVRGELLK